MFIMKKYTFIAAAMLPLILSCKMENPLLTESKLPFGAPQFDKIRNEHYGIYRTEMVRKRMASGTKHTEGHFSFAWILDKNPTPLWVGRNR